MEGFDSLVPNLNQWIIANVISGFDKGNQINQWNVVVIPGAKDALSRYINIYWRPRHEQWQNQSDKVNKLSLSESLLFPSVQGFSALQKTNKNHSYHIQRIAKTVLLRCGIAGNRAHCHAFRKGVVTELLRSGNLLKTVSVFVHHKSTATTEISYDKRKNEELLEKMVVPIGWEALSKDIANANHESQQMEINDCPQEATEATSTTNTDERERIQLSTAMLRAAEHINSLKREIAILKTFLTQEQLEEFDKARSFEQTENRSTAAGQSI